MLVFESAIVSLKRIAAVRGLHHRGGGNAVTVPLFPSFSDPNGLAALGSLRGAEFGMHEPCRLREKYKQKQAGKKLGTSKTFTSEIRGHKVEPSVLPCRRLLAKVDS